MTGQEIFYVERGFRDQRELLLMVSQVQTDEATMKKYVAWLDSDGTRDGLQKILEEQPAERREQPR